MPINAIWRPRHILRALNKKGRLWRLHRNSKSLTFKSRYQEQCAYVKIDLWSQQTGATIGHIYIIFPERGVVRVRWPVLEFHTPCKISATANARDFTFCTRVANRSVSLVVSQCSLSGRGRGHVSNFYIVELENFATASRRHTGDIHNLTVVGLFMTPIRQ